MDKKMFVFSVNRQSDVPAVPEMPVSVEKKQIQRNYRTN